MWLELRLKWKDLTPKVISFELPLLDRELLHIFTSSNFIIFEEHLNIKLERFVFFNYILNVLVHVREVIFDTLKSFKNISNGCSSSNKVRFWLIDIPTLLNILLGIWYHVWNFGIPCRANWACRRQPGISSIFSTHLKDKRVYIIHWTIAPMSFSLNSHISLNSWWLTP